MKIANFIRKHPLLAFIIFLLILFGTIITAGLLLIVLIILYMNFGKPKKFFDANYNNIYKFLMKNDFFANIPLNNNRRSKYFEKNVAKNLEIILQFFKKLYYTDVIIDESYDDFQISLSTISEEINPKPETIGYILKNLESLVTSNTTVFPILKELLDYIINSKKKEINDRNDIKKFKEQSQTIYTHMNNFYKISLKITNQPEQDL
jgi:hypothetical protein